MKVIKKKTGCKPGASRYRALMAQAYSSRSIAGSFSSGSLSSRGCRAAVMRAVKYRSHCVPTRVPWRGWSGACL